MLSINDTTYSGEHAGKYINAAFLSARTLEMDGVKKMMNVKFKSVIQNLNVTEQIIDLSTCDYTDGFTLGTNEIVIEPIELQTTLTLCKQEFHNDWQAKYQFMSANDNVPPAFQDYLLGYVGGLIGSQIETNLWTGAAPTDSDPNTGPFYDTGGPFEGFFTRINGYAAGSGITQLPAAQDQTFTNTGADVETGEFRSTSSATVKGALRDVIKAIPAAVYSKGPASLMLYVGLDVVRALVDSLGTTDNGINNQQQTWWAGGFSGLRFNGLPIFVSTGITGANRGDILATYKDNLIFGTGLMNDMNEATVIDLKKVLGSRNVRIIYRYTAGTQIGNPNDIVYFASGTAKV